jgi:phosphoribosylamine---glycine ligase
MRVLVVDPGGDALDFCLRAQNAGHQVLHWMRSMRETEHIGRGLVTRVPDWRDHIAKADLTFVSDNTHWLRELDAWRDRGARIFGCNQDAATLELDRAAGQKRLAGCGVNVLPYKAFTSAKAAIAYVKAEMKPVVSKPNADADKGMSYVAKTPEDMVYMLERWDRLGKLKGEFILQDFVPGCEMAVGGWFGPGGWNRGWCENWEFKKFMDGDLGVTTGEQGTVLRFVAKSKLAKAVLEPCGDWLESQNYVGYIDVNCIIDDTGTPWPLEFTCRPGWPTFNIQQALLDGDPVEWMVDTLEGNDPTCWELDRIALGVVMTIPDYPYSHLTRKEVVGVPIYGVTPAIAPNIHPLHVMRGEMPIEIGGKITTVPGYVTAGDYCLVTTGTGDTILEAKNMAYRIMGRLKLPNSPQYRTDIGDRLKRQLPDCQKHGFATGMAWDSPRS